MLCVELCGLQFLYVPSVMHYTLQTDRVDINIGLGVQNTVSSLSNRQCVLFVMNGRA